MILYAILFAGVLALLGGLYGKGRADGADKRDEYWKPKVERAELDRDQATQANAKLASEREIVERKAGEATQACQTVSAVGTQTKQDVARTLAGAEKRMSAIEARIAGNLAGTAPSTKPRDEQCNSAETILRGTSDSWAAVLGPSSLPVPRSEPPTPVPTPSAPAPATAPPKPPASQPAKPLPPAIRIKPP